MVSLALGIVFLAKFFQFITNGSSQSPCPNYFRYYRDEITGELMATVEIPSPPKKVPLMLRVTLNVAAALPTQYVGSLELAKSKKESVQAISQGRSLLYRIKFPLQKPIPVLTGITLNNRQLCTGPKAIGQIVTFIALEHTLYPPQIFPLLNNQSNFNKFSDRPGSTQKPRPSSFILQDFPFFDLNANCGIPKNVNRLVAGGDKSFPGQWPWLVAIFLTGIDLEFQCVGNLISTKHIITAAHCLKRNGIELPPNVLLASLGRYFLRDWDEAGSLNMEISQINLHPDFHSVPSADSDLALLVLLNPVKFTPLIQPICLWSGPFELEQIVGKTGYVVGWGKEEKGQLYTGEPRVTIERIASQEVCLRSNPAFLETTSNRTFCAGDRNGRGPCNGDSGSGFVMLNPKTGRFHLRGIVSLSLLDRETMSCDLKQYIVYVDVAKHHNWIIRQIFSDSD